MVRFSFLQSKSLMWVISFVTALTAKKLEPQDQNREKGFSLVLNDSMSCKRRGNGLGFVTQDIDNF